MIEQMDFIHIGAMLLGLLLLVNSILTPTSFKYYLFVYEKPLLGEISDKEMERKKRARSWHRYAVPISEFAVAVGLIYGGISATLGSGVQDWAGGNEINPGRAVITGLGTIATGGFFKWGVGASPAEIYMQSTGRSFSNLPSNIFKNELRYNTTNEVFGGSVSAIIQSRYQTAQSYNASTGASTGGGGSAPSNNSHWVTPSGAVVTFGGQLVIGPAAQSTPATIRQ